MGALEQLGCWLTPSCQAWQAVKLLHHFVLYQLVDVLSVEQKHGLGAPLCNHWRVEFYACTNNSHKMDQSIERPHD